MHWGCTMSTTLQRWQVLDRELVEGVAEEWVGLVAFLLRLDALDQERGWERAGFKSLWEYCLGRLRLRESASGRRIAAMKLLRRFPGLEAPLADGRLCLSTVTILGRILTEENLDELVLRASNLSQEETEHLVATVRPLPAPREGIRKLPAPAPASAPSPSPPPSPETTSAASALAPAERAGLSVPPPLELAPPPARPVPRPTVEPVSADRWSVRFTIDSAQKAELERLQALLSHELPTGDLTAVLMEAVRCATEKHGKRRGAVAPERPRKARPPRPRPEGERQPVALSVLREVWQRDGGRCTYLSQDGRRCTADRFLEFDHVESARLGGPTTAEDLRLRCTPHNLLHAEDTFGRAFMARFRRRPARDAPDPLPLRE